ncbi:MAG: RNA polymerase sigma-70 factor [Chitinophagaceae bacterium]|nr:RNA polymerase sigma-70 factor [Chitinophagaceae bacterium]
MNMILTLQGEPICGTAIKPKRESIIVEDFYKQCFQDYFEKLYDYAFSIVKDNAEAKDIVQYAFIKLWEKRKEVNLLSSARPYLYTSVHRLSLNTVRNRKTREGHHQYLINRETTDSLHISEQKEVKERILLAIDRLPARCKEVFCKSRLEGKKYAEIADEMDISVKTVEGQMGKALKILRLQLADLAMGWIMYLFI